MLMTAFIKSAKTTIISDRVKQMEMEVALVTVCYRNTSRQAITSYQTVGRMGDGFQQAGAVAISDYFYSGPRLRS